MRGRSAQAVQSRRSDVQRVRLLPDRLPQQARLVLVRLGVELVVVRVRLVRLVRVRLVRIGLVRLLRLRLVRVRFVRVVVLGARRDGHLLVSEQGQKKESVFFGFKEFVLRGNVLDLAVAVVVGAAFTAIVNSIVTNVFNPAIGALFNAGSLNKALIWPIPTTSGGTADIAFGAVLAAILQFVIIAVVVYFILVLPLNRLKRIAFARQQNEATEEDKSPLPPSEAELLLQIRDLLAAQADTEVVPTTTGKHAVIAANGTRVP